MDFLGFRFGFVLVSVITILSAAVSPSAQAQLDTRRMRYVPNDLIVKFRPVAFKKKPSEVFGKLSTTFKVAEPVFPAINLYRVQFDTAEGMKVPDAIKLIRTMPEVEWAQPNHYVTRRQVYGGAATFGNVPNDNLFTRQWSLNPNSPAHIKATDAWVKGTGGKDKLGNDIVVAIVDGGVDVQHPDLKENVWINKAEIPANGKDDDQNGYIDDVFGWNAYKDNGSIPAERHGTHVAGIAGARGNNGNQVVGVNWDVKLMAVAAASGTTSIVLKGYSYVYEQKKLWFQSRAAKGANVVSTNSSFGVDYGDCQTEEFKAWNEAYDKLGSVGILSVAATANLAIDVDSKGDVPTGCESAYIVAVTNTQPNDTKYPQAAWGKKHVDLGAPGTDILSTLPGNLTGALTGTSMASPHVAGSIALLHSFIEPQFYRRFAREPSKVALAVKESLIRGVDVTADLKNVTVSGGRLNLNKSAHFVRALR